MLSSKNACVTWKYHIHLVQRHKPFSMHGLGPIYNSICTMWAPKKLYINVDMVHGLHDIIYSMFCPTDFLEINFQMGVDVLPCQSTLWIQASQRHMRTEGPAIHIYMAHWPCYLTPKYTKVWRWCCDICLFSSPTNHYFLANYRCWSIQKGGWNLVFVRWFWSFWPRVC